MSQMPLSPIIKRSCSKDKKSSLSDHIASDYIENSELWESLYPGLNLSYLKQHFYDYCGNRFPQELFFGQWFGGLIELKWKRYISSLSIGRPLSYILKSAHFYDSDFYVDERVLIPRFETEVLLEQIFNELKSLDQSKSNFHIRVAEVGVGPGTIGLTIAQEKYKRALDLVLGDFSDEAIEVCRLNLFRLGYAIAPKNSVSLIKSDRLESFEGQFDLIYSNPPYIKKIADIKGVHEQVIKHEPEMALFLNDHEYKMWFSHFFQQVDLHLNEEGLFIMEGHEYHLEKQLKQIKKIFSCEGEILTDLTGRNRILKVRKKNG